MKYYVGLFETNSHTHAKPIIGQAILCMGRNI